MNQTKKRLSIINLAISITDIETIQLQILKLGLLQTDLKIQEIINALQSENYAQAQGLITLYIEAPTENILQRTSQKKEPVTTTADKKTIDEFQLFVTEDKDEKQTEIDINDFYVDAFETRKDQVKEKEIIKELDLDDFLIDALNIEMPQPKQEEEEKPKEEVIDQIDINNFFSNTPNREKEQTETEKTVTEIDINDFLSDPLQVETAQVKNSDFDALLNISSDDVLPDNITLDISNTSPDTFFETPHQKDREIIDSSEIPKDTFFDTEETVTEETVIQTKTIEESREIEEVEEVAELIEDIMQDKETFFQDLSPVPDIAEKTNPSEYKAIPYIEKKLENMQKQYPAVEQDYENFSTVENLLKKISREAYREAEIEETLTYIKRLVEEEELSQAAKLLLICASTESKFAQFILARELYKGTILTKNVPEAFNLINTLAMDDYPEALCDLGQFYENGIGTTKDTKRARELYKEAMELGIKRANAHHARMKKNRRGLFRR